MSDEIKELAERIARKLFTNGFKQVADHLVLELPGRRYGGGLCRQAVVDQIEDELRRGVK